MSYYQAMVFFHMAGQSQEGKKFGETIGYLEASLKELDVCRKIVKVGIWNWEKIIWLQASFAADVSTLLSLLLASLFFCFFGWFFRNFLVFFFQHTGDDECAVAEAFVRDIIQQKYRTFSISKDDN